MCWHVSLSFGEFSTWWHLDDDNLPIYYVPYLRTNQLDDRLQKTWIRKSFRKKDKVHLCRSMQIYIEYIKSKIVIVANFFNQSGWKCSEKKIQPDLSKHGHHIFGLIVLTYASILFPSFSMVHRRFRYQLHCDAVA